MRRRLLIGILAMVVAVVGVVFAVSPKGVDDGRTKTLSRLMADCISSNEDPGTLTVCVDNVYKSSVAAVGLKTMNAALLEAIAATGRKGALNCHTLSESFGEMYARTNGVASLDNLVYSCLGGPLHGIFYSLGETTPAAEMAEIGKGVCEKTSVGQSWTIGWDCRHGVGHAIALDERVTPLEAYRLCGEVYLDEDDREDCASGVSSSLVNRVRFEGTVAGFDENDPGRWCNKYLTGGLRMGCVTRSGLLVSSNGTDPSEWYALCDDGDLDCVYGIGFGAGNPGQSWKPEYRVAICAKYHSTEAVACMTGLVRHLFPDYYLMGVDTGVCAVAGDLQATCLQEERLMRQREFTVDQLRGVAPVDTSFDRDPVAWPLSKRSL